MHIDTGNEVALRNGSLDDRQDEESQQCFAEAVSGLEDSGKGAIIAELVASSVDDLADDGEGKGAKALFCDGNTATVLTDADAGSSYEESSEDDSVADAFVGVGLAKDKAEDKEAAQEKDAAQPSKRGRASHCVIVRDFPDNLREAEIADFFSGAVLSAAGHGATSSGTRHKSKRGGCPPAPCVSCSIDRGRREARLLFRTEIAASIAACLDGIEYRFSPMRVQRPADYRRDRLKLPSLAGQWDVPLDALLSKSAKYPSNLCATSTAALMRGMGGGNHLVTSAWCEKPWSACGHDPLDGDSEETLRDSLLAGTRPSATTRATSAAARAASSHYETLGVARGATPAEVRRAYYHKCRELNPRLRVSSVDVSAVAEFSQIVEAYKTLCNGRLRDAYDQRQLPHEVHTGHLQYDLRAAAFLLRHLDHKPVVRLESNRATAGPLLLALPRLAKESGTDILALSGANQPSHICEILVAGKHMAASKARALIWDFLHRQQVGSTVRGGPMTGDGDGSRPPGFWGGHSTGMVAGATSADKPSHSLPHSSPYLQQPCFNPLGGYESMGWSQYIFPPAPPPKARLEDDEVALERQVRMGELLTAVEKLLDREIARRRKNGSDTESPSDKENTTEDQRRRKRKLIAISQEKGLTSSDTMLESKDSETPGLFHCSNLSCSHIAASLCTLSGTAVGSGGIRRTQCDARTRLDIAIKLVDRLGAAEAGTSLSSTSPSPFSASISPSRLHRQLLPMSPASMMMSIVSLEEARSEAEAWHQGNLLVVLQSAALDLHQYCDLPRCSLGTAVAIVKAAGKEPFLNLLKNVQSLLVPATVLRIEVELVEETCIWPSSPDGNFRFLSCLCSHIANTFVSGGIPDAHRSEIVRVFRKVAAECRVLGAASGWISVFDPEGLCRLAFALALIAKDVTGGASRSSHKETRLAEQEQFSDALTNIACCAIAHMAHEGSSTWSAQQLMVLITAFVLLQVKHRALFERVANLAQFHIRGGGGWTPEQLWKLLQSAWQLGLLPTMRGLLRFMFMDGSLARRAPSAAGNDLMVLIGAAILLDCPSLIEANCNKRAQEELLGGPLDRIIEALDAWPNTFRWRGVAPLRGELLKAAVRLAGRSAPDSLCGEQVLTLVRVAASEEQRCAEYLRTLGASPAVLAAVPEAAPRCPGAADTAQPSAASVAAACAELATLLAPFSACQVPMPRLESVCAARLLGALCRGVGASALDLPVVCTAVRSLASGVGKTLGAMPGVLAVLARLPAIKDAVEVEVGSQLAALTSAGGYFSVFELLGLLLRCTETHAQEPMSDEDSSDKPLDRWVDVLETMVREAISDVSETLTLSSLSHLCGSVPALQQAKEALGPAWLGALLVRSKNLTWDGGASVHLRSPHFKEAIQALAEDLVAIPTDKRNVPSGKAWPPALVITYALDHSMLETVGGTFNVSGENHGQPVYKRTCPVVSDLDVILYYWDDRDGPDAQGWWFGPAVGSQEVWLRNRSCKPAPPPRNRWEAVKSGEIEDRLNVLDCKTFAAGPWMVDFEDYDDVEYDEEYDEDDDFEADPLPPYAPAVNCRVGSATATPPAPATTRLLQTMPAPAVGTAVARGMSAKVVEDPASARCSGSHDAMAAATTPSLSTVAPQPPRRGPQLRGSVARVGQQNSSARADNEAPEAAVGESPAPLEVTPNGALASSNSSTQVLLRPGANAKTACSAVPSKDERQGVAASVSVAAAPEKLPTPPKRGAARSDADDSELNEKERKLKTWLLELDNGSGILLQYFDVLSSEFDADLSQIAAAKTSNPVGASGIVGIVDPMFWETVRVKKMGHRMLFAKGIAKL